MYKIILSKRAARTFHKLESAIQEQIKASLSELKLFLSDENQKMPDIKKLKGKYKGLYRLRSGDYRIIFDIRNETRMIMVITLVNRQKGFG